MKTTERHPGSHGYQPRGSTYIRRSPSIDSVVTFIDKNDATAPVQPTEFAPKSVETDFAVEDVLKHTPDKSYSFKPAPVRPKKHKPVFKPRRRHIASGAIVLMLLVIGMSGATIATTKRRQHAEVLAAAISTADLAAKATQLEEIPPTSNDLTSYNVEPALPRMLRIQQLGIEMRIRRVGASSLGELLPSRSIYDGAWYDESGKPGDGKPVLIAGHVHGPTKAGTFYNLNKLSPGADLELERGDGRIFRYLVVKTKEYTSPKMDLKQALKSINEEKAGLNLVTFSDVGVNGGYTQNCFLVIAEPIY